MKIYVRVLVFTLFLFSSSLSAQDNLSIYRKKPSPELGIEDFEKAKSLCIEMVNSKNWEKSDSISLILGKKYYLTNPPNYEDHSLYISWITENLHLTKFESIEEAILLESEWKKTNDEINMENSCLYGLLNKASDEQKTVIIKPLLINK